MAWKGKVLSHGWVQKNRKEAWRLQLASVSPKASRNLQARGHMLWATGTLSGLGLRKHSASLVFLFHWPFRITHWAVWEDGEGGWDEEKPQHAGRNELSRAVLATEEAITVPRQTPALPWRPERRVPQSSA